MCTYETVYVVVSRSGSALLVVFVTFSLALLVTLGGWRVVSLQREILFEQKKYYEQFYLTELVLFYGLSVVEKYFYDFLRVGSVELDMSFIAKALGDQFCLTLFVVPEDQSSVRLSSRLKRPGSGGTSELSCLFRFCKSCDGTKGIFVVDDFVVGASV